MIPRVLLVLGLWLGLSVVWAATPDEVEMQRWINSHAQRSHSDELAAARLYVIGDLDGDARNDLAMLYTLRLRAQRGERRYLAVFKRQRDRGRDALRYHAHVLVGGSGAAEANRVTILNKTVVVELLTHRAGDAACCPTRPATRRYQLAVRGLTPVREAAKLPPGTR